MSMNFYAASVALLWTTAMRFGAPDAGQPGTGRARVPSDDARPATLTCALHPRGGILARSGGSDSRVRR
jgi:hypothetical protein